MKLEKRKLGKLTRQPNLVMLLVAIIVNLTIIINNPKLINSYDTPFHISRIIGAWQGWQNGQIIPYINTTALNNLGLGSNFFYGTWQAFLFALVYGITHSIIAVFILFNISVLLIAGISMRKLLLKFVNNFYSTLGAVFYISSPFVLHNLLLTGDQGALLGIMFLPIIIFNLWQIVIEHRKSIVGSSIGASLLLAGHLLSTFLVALTIGILIISLPKLFLQRFVLKQLFKALGLTLFLSCYYWIPLLYLKHINLYNVFNKQVYTMDRTATFLNNSNNWQPYSSLILYINIGLLMLLTVTVIKIFWVNNKTLKTSFGNVSPKKLLCYPVSLTILFYSLSYAPINWSYMPSCFYSLQFKWRFMLIGYFFMTIAMVISLSFWQSTIKRATIQRSLLLSLSTLYALMVLGQMYQYSYSIRHAVKITSRLTTGYKVYNPHTKNDAWYFEYATTGVYQNQKLITTKTNAWLNGQYIRTNHNQVTINQRRKTTQTITFKKIYYPGYRLRLANGKYVQAHYNQTSLVTFQLPKGYRGRVQLVYQTPLWICGLWLFSWSGYLWLSIHKFKQDRILKNR